MRLDRVPVTDRIQRALHAGEMTTPELGARLRVHHVEDALHRLEARGIVVCVEPAHGNIPAVWALVRVRA